MTRLHRADPVFPKSRTSAEGPTDSSLPHGEPPSEAVAALELAGDGGIVVDADRRIVHCSERLLRLLGRRADEVVGRFCAEGLACVNCADGCVLFEMEQVCCRHAKLIASDGAVIHVVKSGRVLRDEAGHIVAAIETIQDVSDLHQEVARASSEAERLERDCTLLRAVADHTGEGLVTVDREGRITCLTAYAGELLGVNAAAVRGKTVIDLVANGGRLFRVLADVLRCGGAEHVDEIVPRSGEDGETRLRARVAAIPDAGGAILGAALAIQVGQAQPRSVDAFHGIVGTSPATRRLISLVETLAGGDVTALVTGESGTGKELVARALHFASPRAHAPFVAVNSATLSEALLESEMFGHARGAFTGADRDKPGQFEICGEGTLLLDEVGCLPASTQAKLLRVLEQREFRRIGGTRTLRLRARIVAATNADLGALVRQGAFRADLYYRLRVVPIDVPALRERRSDILVLARHFAHSLAGGPIAIDPAAERALEAHDWPGNVRELRNAIQFAIATGGGRHVGLFDLPPELHAAGRLPASPGGPRDDEAGDEVALERDRIVHALERARFSRSKAAQALGMSRSTLWRRMRDLGIE